MAAASLMALVVMVLAGVKTAESQEVQRKAYLQRICTSIGGCMPLSSSQHDRHICSYTDTVECMERAMKACRLLNFPESALAEASLQIRELRQLLKTHCTTTSNVPVTSSPASQNHTSSLVLSTSATKRSTKNNKMPRAKDEGAMPTVASIHGERNTTVKSQAPSSLFPSSSSHSLLLLSLLLVVMIFTTGACVS